MKIHFLNVGNGDCTIIEHSENFTIMDVMNARFKDEDARKSFENPYTYIKNKIPSKTIFRYIQSHPDMDHMDGIHTIVPNSITNLWDTEHKKDKPQEFKNGYRELDWDFYEKTRKNASFFYRGTEYIVPKDTNKPKYEYRLYIISPTPALIKSANEKEDWNLSSYVILFEQNDYKVLLGGDASEETWDDILTETKKNSDFKKLISNVGFFKISHHGRKTGYCGKEMLDIINPHFIVISKGSVDSEESSYSSYYQWLKDRHKDDKDRLYMTSKGNVLAEFKFGEGVYSIKYVGGSL